MSSHTSNQPLKKPFALLVKPSGPDCNLRCGYCFYRKVSKTVYPNTPTHQMAEKTLDTLVRRYLNEGFTNNSFGWQGGEPTLMGLDFFKQVVRLQKQYGRSGQTVANGLQTNGLLLDDEWMPFLFRYRFLVGVSLDGPPEIHNFYRAPDTQNAQLYYDRILESLRLLRQYDVAFNLLCVVTDKNVHHSSQLIEYFRNIGATHVQFIPALDWDDTTGKLAPWVCSPQAFGDFLCESFDTWIAGDPTQFSIRDFDAILSLCLDQPSTICTYSPQCNHYLMVEHNGDVYPCDFYCQPEWCLGNINDCSFSELSTHARYTQFSSVKQQLPPSCKSCQWLPYCYGGCPKDRQHPASHSLPRPSYFCQSYQQFFQHVLPRLRQLTQAFNAASPPATADTPSAQVSRNAPCPCGSGKKFKRCCGKPNLTR